VYAGATFVGCSRGDDSPGPGDAKGSDPTEADEMNQASGIGTEPEAPPAEYTLVTEVGSMESVVTALKYTNQSAKADESCSNCIYYTPEVPDRGRCSLFQTGFVASGGWCTSWAEKPAN
jgi:hypothetical protein